MRNPLPLSVLLVPLCAGLADVPRSGQNTKALNDSRSFAMTHLGDAERGEKLFLDEQRLACARCHTVDGKGGRAGPDLFAIGDKFGRRERIAAVLMPSATV